MDSYVVPYTDDQIEVDAGRRTVSLFRNAWNRESSGYPDETYTFDELTADPALLAPLLAMLAPSDAAEMERRIQS